MLNVDNGNQRRQECLHGRFRKLCCMLIRAALLVVSVEREDEKAETPTQLSRKPRSYECCSAYFHC